MCGRRLSRGSSGSSDRRRLPLVPSSLAFFPCFDIQAFTENGVVQSFWEEDQMKCSAQIVKPSPAQWCCSIPASRVRRIVLNAFSRRRTSIRARSTSLSSARASVKPGKVVAPRGTLFPNQLRTAQRVRKGKESVTHRSRASGRERRRDVGTIRGRAAPRGPRGTRLQSPSKRG